MSAIGDFIKSLPDLIRQEKNIDFEFSHIECVDNHLFLWNDYYSQTILRINLETKEIQTITIKKNIKIDSLKVISRNKSQFLLISENKLKSQIHFINIKNTEQQFSYQSFSSNILQIEHSSISSNTVFVLTNHNFNIIGLNDECNEIIYHDRIDILGKQLVNFCLGNPKHLHDKLFNEYNFYYGFSKFAAYFINKHGEIYICSPIIPHTFQCTLQFLDTLRYNFDETDAEHDELYDLWINASWNISTNTDINASILNAAKARAQSQPYATYNAKTQFVYDNKAVFRSIYKLNIHQTESIKNTAFCTKIMMLDLDPLFFNDQRLQKNESIQTYEEYINKDEEDDGITHVLPIFIRIWSNHSIDIVCCGEAIRTSFDFNNADYEPLINDDFDGFVISKNYLDFNDDENHVQNAQNPCLILSKCIQNLDEVIVGHTLQGIYRLKMKWLNKIPYALSENGDKNETYFKLLQQSTSNIEQIPLYKFYMNSHKEAERAILSDLCIVNLFPTNDELIILDEHLKKMHAFPLYNIDMNKYDENDSDRKEEKLNEINIETQFDLRIMKPYNNDEIEEIQENMKRLIFDIDSFPNDFSLTNPDSLKWFVENIKMKMEKQVLNKLELGHLLMNERRQFIENQMHNYIVPQILLIEDKMKQIQDSNRKLKTKIKDIMQDHTKLEEKIENLKVKMKECDNFYNNDKNDMRRFKSILKDFEKEVEAAQYDYTQLNRYKREKSDIKNRNEIKWTKQDMLHLNGKIKKKIINSDQSLKQMINGLQQMQI